MITKRALSTSLVLLLFSWTTTAFAEPLETIAKRLSKPLKPLKITRIAVLTFPFTNGYISSGSSIIAERLTTLMVERGGAEVVERTLLDKAMSEIRLGMSGALNPDSTQKLGKILGVTAIVTGTLNDLENQQTEINARLIDSETGAILAAASTRVNRTWEDIPHPAPLIQTNEEDSHHKSTLIFSPPRPLRRGGEAPISFRGDPNMTLQRGPSSTPGDILTLTNEDLISMDHRTETDPTRVLNDFLTERTPPPNAVGMARGIYHRNPDPKLRARALITMGHLLERSGQPQQAAEVYSQALREFSDTPLIQAEARQRLNEISPPP